MLTTTMHAARMAKTVATPRPVAIRSTNRIMSVPFERGQRGLFDDNVVPVFVVSHGPDGRPPWGTENVLQRAMFSSGSRPRREDRPAASGRLRRDVVRRLGSSPRYGQS